MPRSRRGHTAVEGVTIGGSERKLRDIQPNSVLCLRVASYVLQESMGELDHHVDQVVTRERMPSNVKHKRLYQTKSFSVKR